jgi:polysaccharide pyruvyl transferase WcaK-like protein
LENLSRSSRIQYCVRFVTYWTEMSDNMDIGVIGWWSYDNAGDLAMLAALRRGLAPHHVVPIDTGFSANPDIIYRLNRLDYVILGGGTLIPGKPTAPFDDFDRWANQLESPLGVVGLGVDPFPERYWPAVRTLLDRAKFFYVRDQESRSLLRDHPKVKVSPDLTFAYPLPIRDEGDGDDRAITVCGVNLRRSGLSSFDPVPWVEALKDLPVQIRSVPLSSADIFDEMAILSQLDPESPKRFDPTIYRGIDFMIGTAFHSVLFAVQTGVPIIAIDYAPKVRHFMTDNGLTRYLLAPGQYDRLAALVEELLTNCSQFRRELRAVRRKLTRESWRSLTSVREQIECDKSGRQRTGPKATIVVVGSGSVEKNQRTQASCAAQTYENVEVRFVPADPREGLASCLQRESRESSGDYLTWIQGGDLLVDDAMDTLISLLEEKPDLDVVYADYYAMSNTDFPIGRHTVPEPQKLYRRDVVGPCFLFRRTLLPLLSQIPVDTPLPAYSLWLLARANHQLVPFHAPLGYSKRPINSRSFVDKEREARRRWRETGPAWKRPVWRIIDSDLGERFLVQPVACLLKLIRGVKYA